MVEEEENNWTTFEMSASKWSMSQQLPKDFRLLGILKQFNTDLQQQLRQLEDCLYHLDKETMARRRELQLREELATLMDSYCT